MTVPARPAPFNNRTNRLLGALAAVLASTAAQAESVYVIDQLVITVASNPGGEGDPVGTVKSGDRLEVLERQNEEAHVRLPNGTEGWIKESYLSADQPLPQRLTDPTPAPPNLHQPVPPRPPAL